jgi:hypothetical protein
MHDMPLLPADVPDLNQPLDPFGPMPVYDVAWYERAWPARKFGYLFVLAPNLAQPGRALHPGDFIDLNPNYMAARINRPQAGLIFADKAVHAGDLNCLLCAFSGSRCLCQVRHPS